MGKKIDWNSRQYMMGKIDEFCRNNNCDWRISRSNETGYDEFEICPKCGTITDSAINFGGLIIHYNRVKDNFTLKSRGSFGNQAYVDSADCPDALLFMIRHYRFHGWPEAVTQETQK